MSFRAEPNGEVGDLAFVRDRHIEMVHAGPNVVNDRGDLRSAVGCTLADHEYPDRLIELAYAFHWRAELQFGAKRDLEESVLDLIIGKIRSLGSAPTADVRIFRMRRTVADPREHERGQREGHCYRFAGQAHPSCGYFHRRGQGAG